MTYNALMKPGPEEHVIDPLLTFSPPPSRYEHYEGVAQLQRYLREPQSVFFSPAAPIAPTPEQIEPYSPESQPRSSSSLSRHRPAAYGGGQSDLTDSDFCQTNSQGPTTPRDMAILSPYIAHAPYEPMDQHSLAGIARDYVHLSDISPAYDAQLDCVEKDDGFEFNPGAESFFDPALSSQFPEDQSQEMSTRMNRVLVLEAAYPDLDSIGGDVRPAEEAVAHTDPASIRAERESASTGRGNIRGRRSTAKRGRPPKRTAPLSQLTKSARVSKGLVAIGNTTRKRDLSTTMKLRCLTCLKVFPDEAALEKHDSNEHRRYFTCVFQFAGCGQSFNSKNEWKRHVSSQHLSLKYWLCTHDDCGQAQVEGFWGIPSSTLGRPFKRKDLFTQHYRRMHLDAPASGPSRGNEAGASIEMIQKQAERQRGESPTYMRCALPECTAKFNGGNALNDYMEHVAGHMGDAGIGRGPAVNLGGPSDDTLTSWAASEAVNVIRRTPTGWVLCEPPKAPRDDR